MTFYVIFMNLDYRVRYKIKYVHSFCMNEYGINCDIISVQYS